MTTHIQIQQHTTKDGKSIAHITLNHPKTLNALTLDMVKFLSKKLTWWANDDNVAMVVIQGGERAFCAGGDIKSLQSADIDDVRSFFNQEYDLMYQMYTYSKPILAWGHGVVMGGGLGLLSASSHKVVTFDTVMAMPEVSIGLFPDAGGSYFLNRMMGKVGLFLGLTGARFTGVDAYYLGLADAVCHQGDFDEVLGVLQNTSWQGDCQNHALLNTILADFHQSKMATDSQIIKHYDEINRLMSAGDLTAVDKVLLDYTGHSAYIKTATDIYRQGSAISKALTWCIYHQVKTWSLSEIFAMEKVVAVNCVINGDFKEGVRALLIDKDKNPKWRYVLENLPEDDIERYFNNV